MTRTDEPMDTGPMRDDLTVLYTELLDELQREILGKAPRLLRPPSWPKSRICRFGAALAAAHVIAFQHFTDYANGQPARRHVTDDLRKAG